MKRRRASIRTTAGRDACLILEAMTIDVANSLYLVCTAAGGLLLLASIVLDDYLDRSLDALRMRFELGGASFVQLLLAFLTGFGIGGLVGILVLHLSVSSSALVGIAGGFLTIVLIWALFAFTRRRGTGPGFDLDDLVGYTGTVDAAITTNEHGMVTVTYAGDEQHHPATAPEDIAAGAKVLITDATATSLTVVPALDQGREA
jgi:membrane protein implicated in regulation of membrane protease activity